jgi:hypothetical protein
MADFFHLFRYNTMAGNVGNIPSVPDEAANGEHRDSVTHCVTKSRRSSGRKRPLLVSSWRGGVSNELIYNSDSSSIGKTIDE